MKPIELKKLVTNFTRTLESEESHEWFGTEKELWETFTDRFLRWYGAEFRREEAKLKKGQSNSGQNRRRG